MGTEWRWGWFPLPSPFYTCSSTQAVTDPWQADADSAHHAHRHKHKRATKRLATRGPPSDPVGTEQGLLSLLG